MISQAIEKGSRQGSGKAGERLTLSQSAVIASVFLAFHLLLVFWRPNPFWGADLLSYYPTPLWILFILPAVLIFIPGIRSQVRIWVCAVPFTIWGNGRNTWLTRTVILLIALAVFIAFRTANHLLGDGYLYLRELDGDILQRFDRAPLTFALIRTLHKLGSPLWETAENTYRIYSYASGLLFVLLCFPVAGAIGRYPREKSIVLAFLLTGGYVQLFFGYVENYPFYIPGILLYLLVGLHALEGRLPLWVPSLLLGMLVAFHLVFFFFGPSLLVLAYFSYDRKECRPRYKKLLATLAALCLVLPSAGFLLWYAGIDFMAYLGRLAGGHHLPVFAEPGFCAPYHLWSLSHLLDFLNIQLLSAPAALMTCFVLRKKDLNHQPFLAAAAAFPLVFAFSANPGIGAFRDWDILALPAIPLTLWSADALLKRIRDPQKQFHTAFPICAAAALHGLLWIGLNANEVAAEARYVHQIDKLTGHAGSYGWETLGAYYNLQKKPSAALTAYKRAMEINPKNSRHWRAVGLTYEDMDQPVNAIKHFMKAIELQPGNAAAYVNLGVVYGKTENLEKAAEYLNKAVELDPNNAHAHFNLGIAYNKMGKHALAIGYLKKAAEIKPDYPTVYIELGFAYKAMGQIDNAIEYLKKAVQLQPGLVATWNNLGNAYHSMGQHANAIEHYKKAIKLQPDNATVHLNLGGTYHSMGKHANAIEYLKKAAGLQPEDESVHLNLGAAYHSLGKYEKAVLHLQKSIQINPAFTNAYYNLGIAYHSLNRMKEAKASMQKVLELNPDDPLAPKIRQFLEKGQEL